MVTEIAVGCRPANCHGWGRTWGGAAPTEGNTVQSEQGEGVRPWKGTDFGRNADDDDDDDDADDDPSSVSTMVGAEPGEGRWLPGGGLTISPARAKW